MEDAKPVEMSFKMWKQQRKHVVCRHRGRHSEYPWEQNRKLQGWAVCSSGSRLQSPLSIFNGPVPLPTPPWDESRQRCDVTTFLTWS